MDSDWSSLWSLCCWSCGDQDASILPVWRYCQHSLKDGIHWPPFENSCEWLHNSYPKENWVPVPVWSERRNVLKGKRNRDHLLADGSEGPGVQPADPSYRGEPTALASWIFRHDCQLSAEKAGGWDKKPKTHTGSQLQKRYPGILGSQHDRQWEHPFLNLSEAQGLTLIQHSSTWQQPPVSGRPPALWDLGGAEGSHGFCLASAASPETQTCFCETDAHTQGSGYLWLWSLISTVAPGSVPSTWGRRGLNVRAQSWGDFVLMSFVLVWFTDSFSFCVRERIFLIVTIIF